MKFLNDDSESMFTQFQEVMKDSKGFQEIHEIEVLCDAYGIWTERFNETAMSQRKHAQIRQWIKQMKDETGWPAWASIEIETQDGQRRRVYQLEFNLDWDEYIQVHDYHRRVARHHDRMADGYMQRGLIRYPKQLSIIWDQPVMAQKEEE